MSPKTIFSILLFAFCTSFTLAQEPESVLTAPDTWQSEIIPFPIGFAREIEYKGFEELRFSPGWSDMTSQEFWTYMFVWYIEQDEPLTEQKLTESFNLYYDGLMNIDINNQNDSTGLNQLDKTICLFIKTEAGFSGKMRVFDRFFTKKYIVLNIQVREMFCSRMKKQIISCEISPQAFDHEVWKIFDQVKLKVNCE